MIIDGALFYCEVSNANERSAFLRWEIETVVHWTDEHGDRNVEAVRDGEDLDRLVDVYGGDVQYGVYGRRRDGTAEHIKDYDRVSDALDFVGRLNGGSD